MKGDVGPNPDLIPDGGDFPRVLYPGQRLQPVLMARTAGKEICKGHLRRGTWRSGIRTGSAVWSCWFLWSGYRPIWRPR